MRPARIVVAASRRRAYVEAVKRFLGVIVVLLALAAATPAAAQGKDPFRPPGGFTEQAPGSTTPGDTVQVPPGNSAGDGLARTGQDLEGLALASLFLVVTGAGLRAAAKGLRG